MPTLFIPYTLNQIDIYQESIGTWFNSTFSGAPVRHMGGQSIKLSKVLGGNTGGLDNVADILYVCSHGNGTWMTGKSTGENKLTADDLGTLLATTKNLS